MNEITPAEQEELDALLAKERQSSDQQELDALLRKERQSMVSRIASPEATREERMQSMREMRGGGGPMSSSAETTTASSYFFFSNTKRSSAFKVHSVSKIGSRNCNCI